MSASLLLHRPERETKLKRKQKGIHYVKDKIVSCVQCKDV